MPRGSSKTSIARAASLWAVLGGHRRFVVYIAANSKKATDTIDSLKKFVRLNTLLYEDFGPELHGFVKLENQSRRCEGQKCNGVSTDIGWGASEIVFPTVPGGSCNRAVIAAFGIGRATSSARRRLLATGRR